MKSYLNSVLLLALAIVCLSIINFDFSASQKPHHCSWVNCKSEGKFKAVSDCEFGSDCYYFEVTHFNHPEFSEDECENYIFEIETPLVDGVLVRR